MSALDTINNGESGSSARGKINAVIGAVNGIFTAGVGLWVQVDVAGAYNSDVTDLGRSWFTDVNASGQAQLILPPLESAAANGGTIRVSSGREYNSDNNCISVYCHSGDNGNLFLYGTQTLYSMYSTGVGDFIELIPMAIGGNLFWQVLNPCGFWQDRD